MSTGAQATLLTLGPSGPAVSVTFENRDDEARIRALVAARGGSPLVAELVSAGGDDVEGHAESASIDLTLRLAEEDVAGHAISVHFPTAQDAARFRRNLIAGSLLASTLVIGSAGAIVISTQSGAPATPASTERTPVYERPAGRGALEGVDIEAPVPVIAPSLVNDAPAIDAATGRPAGAGFLEGTEGPVTTDSTGMTQLPPGTGLLEGIDE